MKIGQKHKDILNIKCNNNNSKKAESFSFLDSNILSDGKVKQEVIKTMCRAETFCLTHKDIIWNMKMSEKIKVTLHKMCHVPILTYRAKRQTWTERDGSK